MRGLIACDSIVCIIEGIACVNSYKTTKVSLTRSIYDENKSERKADTNHETGQLL